MTEDAFERLEAEARRRWGDAWAISATRWSDGSIQAYAFHSRGLANGDEDQSVYERDRLWIDDGEVLVERVHVRMDDAEQIDVIERVPVDAADHELADA